ncbi:hypothetical protein CEXT_112651 [Caerostris extrusa]|uniref:Uncharacterized protein n=1 Tax=Caerostris extrusa TaxID=172846 RepID=A0AAV4N388_CAEEX|nr:hypothetical protein CEXT_112651 [Caerostris extrusa]
MAEIQMTPKPAEPKLPGDNAATEDEANVKEHEFWKANKKRIMAYPKRRDSKGILMCKYQNTLISRVSHVRRTYLYNNMSSNTYTETCVINVSTEINKTCACSSTSREQINQHPGESNGKLLARLLNKEEEEMSSDALYYEEAMKKIRWHKKALDHVMKFHLQLSVFISFCMPIFVMFDWLLVKGHNYDQKVLPLLLLLMFTSLQNMYIMKVLRVYSFSNIFPITIMWMLLGGLPPLALVAIRTSVPGPMRRPLCNPYRCDGTLVYLAGLYSMVAFAEYCVACVIHACMILKLNRHAPICSDDLLAQSVINYPLALVLLIRRIFAKLCCAKKQPEEAE